MAVLANTTDGMPVVWGEEIVGPQPTATPHLMVEYEAEIAVCAPQMVKVIFTVARPGWNLEVRSPEAEREACKSALREYVTNSTREHLIEFGSNPVFVRVKLQPAA